MQMRVANTHPTTAITSKLVFRREIILSCSYVYFNVFGETKSSELHLETWPLGSGQFKHLSNIQNDLTVFYIRTWLQQIVIRQINVQNF